MPLAKAKPRHAEEEPIDPAREAAFGEGKAQDVIAAMQRAREHVRD